MFQNCKVLRCDTLCPYESSFSDPKKPPKDPTSVLKQTNTDTKTKSVTATTVISSAPSQTTILKLETSEEKTTSMINVVEIKEIPQSTSLETTSPIIPYESLDYMPEELSTLSDSDKDLINMSLEEKLSYSQIAKRIRRNEDLVKMYIESKASSSYIQEQHIELVVSSTFDKKNVFFLNQSGHNIKVIICDENAAIKLENSKSQEIVDGHGVFLSAKGQKYLNIFISEATSPEKLEFGNGYHYDGNVPELYLDHVDRDLLEVCLEHNRTLSQISTKIKKLENQIQPYIVAYNKLEKQSITF